MQELNSTKQDNMAQFKAFAPRKKAKWQPVDDVQDRLESETTREDRKREFIINQTI